MRRLAVVLTTLALAHPAYAVTCALSPGTGTLRTVGSGQTYADFTACTAAAAAGDVCEAGTGSYAGWTVGSGSSTAAPITYRCKAANTCTITSTVTATNKQFVLITGFATTSGRVLNVSDATPGNHLDWCNNVSTGAGAGGGGGTTAFYVYGANNTLEYNTVSMGGDFDCFDVGGQNVVIRRNTCQNANAGGSTAEHMDHVQVFGGAGNPAGAFDHSLIESEIDLNRTNNGGNVHYNILGCPTGLTCDSDISRYGYAENLDADGPLNFGADATTNLHFYNNTVASGSKYASGGCLFGSFGTSSVVFLNNLSYNDCTNPTNPISLNNSATVIRENGNLITDSAHIGSAWTSAQYTAEATYAVLHSKDPVFANFPTDGTLQATSPAINAADALTTVDASDTGSGTSLIVTDGHFFQCGWGAGPGVQCDTIKVGTQTPVQITGISYGAGLVTTLTLASSVTRASGDPVRLYAGSDGVQLLYSTDGDVGAFPFGSPVTPTGGGKNRLRLRIRMGDLALLGAILPIGWRLRRSA